MRVNVSVGIGRKRKRGGTDTQWKGSPATLIGGDSSTFHINALSSKAHCSDGLPRGKVTHKHTHTYMSLFFCLSALSWRLTTLLFVSLHCCLIPSITWITATCFTIITTHITSLHQGNGLNIWKGDRLKPLAKLTTCCFIYYNSDHNKSLGWITYTSLYTVTKDEWDA